MSGADHATILVAGPPGGQGRRASVVGTLVGCLGTGGGLTDLGAEDGRLGAALHAELGQQRGHVVLDGLLGQEEPFADLAVGQSFRDEVENLSLSDVRRARPADRAARDGAAGSAGAAGHGGVEQGPAAGDGADGVDEGAAADLLQQVAGGAGHHRGEQGLVVVVGGEDQAADPG